MQKRITLLRRHLDLTETAFRNHWAGVHAAIATGFEGLARYNQNRVAQKLWQTGGGFSIDGVVELWFDTPEVVVKNATSQTTAALIEDEPNFLSGLTGLSIGAASVSEPDTGAEKLMLFLRCEDNTASKEAPVPAVAALDPIAQSTEILTPAFIREALWAEPEPPTMVLILWLSPRAMAQAANPEGALAHAVRYVASRSVALAVDPLRIV